MAESNRSHFSVDELKQRFLECDICSELFNEENRHPRLLPCLHTLCKECIVKLIKDETIQCPKCTKLHNAPENSFEFFPKDNTRRDLLDFVTVVLQKPSAILCESCDTNQQAKFRCKDCSDFLCIGCHDFHAHSKRLKSHQTFSIENVKQDDEKLEDFKHKSLCSVPEHEDEKLNFYCDKDTCKKPVCTVCAIAEHKETNGHIIRAIKDVYNEQKLDLEIKEKGLEEKQETVRNVIQAVNIEQSLLEQSGTKAKENISAQFETCVKILERRKNSLMETIDNSTKQKHKILQTQKEEMQSFNENVMDAVSFFNQSLLYKNHPAFLEIVKTIENRFKDLADRMIDTVPYENGYIKFLPHQMGMEFQKYVNEAGTVEQTSAYPHNTIVEIEDQAYVDEAVNIKVYLNDYSKTPVSVYDAKPTIDVEHENRDPIVFPCQPISEGKYQTEIKLEAPGKYNIYVSIMGNHIPSSVKEIVIKEKVADAVNNQNQKESIVTDVDENSELPKENAVEKQKEGVVEVWETDGGKTEKHDTGNENPKVSTSDVSAERENVMEQLSYIRDVSGMDFKLDASSLYKDRYISDDGLTISNTETDTTHPVECGETSFTNYRGVRATSPICRPQNCIIEVEVQFNNLKLTSSSLVFEIAFATKEKTDVNHYCGAEGWGIHATNCKTCSTICIFNQSKTQDRTHIYSFSENTAGTPLNCIIIFLVNTEQNQIHVIERNRGLIHTFTDVDCNEELWPLFAVYNPRQIKTQITLRNVVKGNNLKLPSF